MAQSFLTGFEMKLFQEAQHDIEYKSSRFWQIFLQRQFPLSEDYGVVCEQAPDESRRRVDITVLRYDSTNHTLSTMVFVEVKRRGGDIRNLELQALDAAKRAIDADDLLFVYVMTAWGLQFRVWLVDNRARALQPVDNGPNRRASAEDYLYVSEPNHLSRLNYVVSSIKGQPPLRRPITLESQTFNRESA